MAARQAAPAGAGAGLKFQGIVPYLPENRVDDWGLTPEEQVGPARVQRHRTWRPGGRKGPPASRMGLHRGRRTLGRGRTSRRACLPLLTAPPRPAGGQGGAVPGHAGEGRALAARRPWWVRWGGGGGCGGARAAFAPREHLVTQAAGQCPPPGPARHHSLCPLLPGCRLLHAAALPAGAQLRVRQGHENVAGQPGLARGQQASAAAGRAPGRPAGSCWDSASGAQGARACLRGALARGPPMPAAPCLPAQLPGRAPQLPGAACSAAAAWRRRVDTMLEEFVFHEREQFLMAYPQGYHKTDKLVSSAHGRGRRRVGGWVGWGGRPRPLSLHPNTPGRRAAAPPACSGRPPGPSRHAELRLTGARRAAGAGSPAPAAAWLTGARRAAAAAGGRTCRGAPSTFSSWARSTSTP